MAPSNSNTGFWIKSATDSDACIIALAPDSNPPESAPVRIGPCSSSGDAAKWYFVPDGSGRFYAYSQVMGDQSRRLDFVKPDGMPSVAILGPSDAKYNNQHWSFPSPGSPAGSITSYGRPGALLTTAQIGDVQAVVVQDTPGSATGNTKWGVVSPVAAVAALPSHTPDDAPSSVESHLAASASETISASPTKSASMSTSPDVASVSTTVSSQSVSGAASSATPTSTSSSSTNGPTTATITSGHGTQPSSPPNTTDAQRNNIARIAGGAGGGFVFLVLLCFVGVCLRRRYNKNKAQQGTESNGDEGDDSNALTDPGASGRTETQPAPSVTDPASGTDDSQEHGAVSSVGVRRGGTVRSVVEMRNFEDVTR